RPLIRIHFALEGVFLCQRAEFLPHESFRNRRIGSWQKPDLAIRPTGNHGGIGLLRGALKQRSVGVEDVGAFPALHFRRFVGSHHVGVGSANIAMALWALHGFSSFLVIAVGVVVAVL